MCERMCVCICSTQAHTTYNSTHDVSFPIYHFSFQLFVYCSHCVYDYLCGSFIYTCMCVCTQCVIITFHTITLKCTLDNYYSTPRTVSQSVSQSVRRRHNDWQARPGQTSQCNQQAEWDVECVCACVWRGRRASSCSHNPHKLYIFYA